MYKQHCIAGLSEDVGALRNAALYVAEHRDAILWALELCGFKDVALKVRASLATSVDFNLLQSRY